MKNLMALVLLVLFAPQVLGSRVYSPGIFNDKACLAQLVSIREARGSRYLEDATDIKGLTNLAEISEYVERRVRIRYLNEELVRIYNESELAETVFVNLVERGVFKDLTQAQRQSTIKELFEKFSSEWLPGETLAAEQFPLLVGIAIESPPKTVQEVAAVVGIMHIHILIAAARANFSELTLQMPLNQQVPNLPMLGYKRFSALTKTFEDFNPKDLIGVTPEEILTGSVGSALGALKRDVPKLADLILNSNVPKAVKDVVSKEMDFHKKYDLPPTFLSLLLMKSIADYFKLK